ncbi:AraC family transcriptional regulator [Prolixibacteraceae bacterium JC049]|nr:AraC family transcriptional regulator [Prolixibacteraceae bacterium JC049]
MNDNHQDYIFRINKVIDYIEAHLTEELNVETLASIAYFSPYHFHRIFTALVGETLISYLKRRRVEKAARLLLNERQMAVAEIAEVAGFSNASVFCRNFKKHFGVSAQTFRDENSKNRQLQSNKWQSRNEDSDYICRENLINLKDVIMNAKVVVKEMPQMEMMYCRHVGEFNQVGQAFGTLMRWAGPKGLLSNPELKTAVVFHDDPDITPQEKNQQSACIIVDKPMKAEGEIGHLTVAAHKYAVGSFEVTEHEFAQAWKTIYVWIFENGYQPADLPPYQLHHNDFQQHPERKFIVDICVPVK